METKADALRTRLPTPAETKATVQREQDAGQAELQARWDAHFEAKTEDFFAALEKAAHDLNNIAAGRTDGLKTHSSPYIGWMSSFERCRWLGALQPGEENWLSGIKEPGNWGASLDMFIDFPAVARDVYQQGFFLLRSKPIQMTYTKDAWSRCKYHYLFSHNYFLALAWSDRDEIGLVRSSEEALSIDWTSFKADLALLGLSDVDVQRRWFGSQQLLEWAKPKSEPAPAPAPAPVEAVVQGCGGCVIC